MSEQLVAAKAPSAVVRAACTTALVSAVLFARKLDVLIADAAAPKMGGRELGPDEVLRKPLDAATLQGAIARLVRSA